MTEAFYISGSNVEMFGAAWFSDSSETCLTRNYEIKNEHPLKNNNWQNCTQGCTLSASALALLALLALPTLLKLPAPSSKRVDYWVCFSEVFWNEMHSPSLSLEFSCYTMLYLLVRLHQALLLLWACRNSSRFARVPQKAGSTSMFSRVLGPVLEACQTSALQETNHSRVIC